VKTTKLEKACIDDPIELLKWRCEHDLLFLLNWGLGFRDVDPAGRIPYQVKLAEFYTTDGDRKMILIPREHFKSTFAKGYIVQELLKNRNKTIFVRSHTWRKAITFISVIQDRLMRPQITRLYGDLKGDVWREDAINIAGRTDKEDEYNIYATGTGQSITGYHPDEMILDDILDDENYNTEEGKLAVENDYKKLLFCVKKRVIINGTRWGEDDLYGDLLEKNRYINPNDADYYKTLIMSAFGEADKNGETPEDGNLLFPYTYRNDKPEELKGVTKGWDWIASKKRLGHYFYSCQVLNKALPQKDAVFKNDDFNLWDYGRQFKEESRGMDFYMTVDPAGTDRKYSDFTAIVVCGITKDYDIYVAEAKQFKVDITKAHKIIDQIFKYASKWNVKKVGIEKGILERALKKPIKDRQKYMLAHGQTSFVLKGLKYHDQPGKSGFKKKERIASLAPYFDAGMIHIRRDLDDLQRQLMRWRPYSTSHDDLVDAFAYQLQVIPFHIYKEVEKKNQDWFFRSLEKKRRWHKKGYDRDLEYLNQEAFNG